MVRWAPRFNPKSIRQMAFRWRMRHPRAAQVTLDDQPQECCTFAADEHTAERTSDAQTPEAGTDALLAATFEDTAALADESMPSEAACLLSSSCEAEGPDCGLPADGSPCKRKSSIFDSDDQDEQFTGKKHHAQGAEGENKENTEQPFRDGSCAASDDSQYTLSDEGLAAPADTLQESAGEPLRPFHVDRAVLDELNESSILFERCTSIPSALLGCDPIDLFGATENKVAVDISPAAVTAEIEDHVPEVAAQSDPSVAEELPEAESAKPLNDTIVCDSVHEAELDEPAALEYFDGNCQEIGRILSSIIDYITEPAKPRLELLAVAALCSQDAQPGAGEAPDRMALRFIQNALSSVPFREFFDRLREVIAAKDAVIKTLEGGLQSAVQRMRCIDTGVVESKLAELEHTIDTLLAEKEQAAAALVRENAALAGERTEHVLQLRNAESVQSGLEDTVACLNRRVQLFKDAMSEASGCGKAVHAELDALRHDVSGLADVKNAFSAAFDQLVSDHEAARECLGSVGSSLREQVCGQIELVREGSRSLEQRCAELLRFAFDSKAAAEKAFQEQMEVNESLHESLKRLTAESSAHKQSNDALTEGNAELQESLRIKNVYVKELEAQLDDVLKLNNFYEAQLLESDTTIKALKEESSRKSVDIAAEMNKIKRSYFKENALLKLRIEELELELKNK
ncbi:hypothetical protein PAPHI01_0034 [Pancytospora philotis]|nr:hypothetical protein PAPHI01_0034 [Pancytospora philotis]